MSEHISGGCGVVLLVEADASSRARLGQALIRDDSRLDVVTAASVAGAVSLIAAARPDLIISAGTLPDGTGLDLIGRLLHLGEAAPVWIVDTTSDGTETDAAEAIRAGAADYLALDSLTLAKLPLLACRAIAGTRARRSRERADHAECGRDLASISHDLRSPLAGLVALVDLLETGSDGPLSPAQQRRVARIRAAVERLTGVADGIADLAQVEAGRLTLSRGPVDLEEITRAVRRSIDPLLSSRAVVLQVLLSPDLPPLHGDPSRIGQILMTLVTAILRQVEGTTIELAASGRASMVELTLREGSRGLPVEALPPEFTQIAESDGRPMPAQPTGAPHGVSFSLARRLATLHGGSLSVGRDADGGLVATFTLPCDPPDARPRADRPQDLRSTT